MLPTNYKLTATILWFTQSKRITDAAYFNTVLPCQPPLRSVFQSGQQWYGQSIFIRSYAVETAYRIWKPCLPIGKNRGLRLCKVYHVYCVCSTRIAYVLYIPLHLWWNKKAQSPMTLNSLRSTSNWRERAKHLTHAA